MSLLLLFTNHGAGGGPEPPPAATHIPIRIHFDRRPIDDDELLLLVLDLI